MTAPIGVGGMGEVYHATDTNLKRAVAIKVLPASVAADFERLARCGDTQLRVTGKTTAGRAIEASTVVHGRLPHTVAVCDSLIGSARASI